MTDYTEHDNKMTEVAAALGPKWEWRTGNPNLPEAQRINSHDRGHFSGYLYHPFNGLALFVSGGWRPNEQTKLEIGPAWPYNDSGEGYRSVSLRDLGLIPYGETDPRIGVSLKRSPKAIAADIMRRLIEGENLCERLEQVRDKLRERAEYADRKHELRAELTAIIGGKMPSPDRDHREGSVDTYGLKDGSGWSYGTVNVNGDDSVRIECSVSAELARKILKAIAA